MFLIVRFVYEITLLPHCTAGGCFHLLSDIPYCLANFQHERRRNGKLVDSHAEGLLGKRRIRREFAAYSNPRVVLVGVLGAHLDEPQNRLTMPAPMIAGIIGDIQPDIASSTAVTGLTFFSGRSLRFRRRSSRTSGSHDSRSISRCQ